MELGVLIKLNGNPEKEFKKVADLGFSSCQLDCWDVSLFTDETAERVKKAASDNSVRISALWCGWSGPAVWNFYEGPLTLGLVPVQFRYARMQELKQGSDFAAKIGTEDMITHMGFLPENPNTAEYSSLIPCIRDIAEYCKKNGQHLLFETGQETPVTLRRTIEDVGTGNLGINLDPANLILYGKANPTDALDVFGEYVRNIHAKDGKYPTDGKCLGKETPLGKGSVNFPLFIQRLKQIGYTGPITIEREIDGEEQIRDINAAKKYLEELI